LLRIGDFGTLFHPSSPYEGVLGYPQKKMTHDKGKPLCKDFLRQAKTVLMTRINKFGEYSRRV